MKKIFLIFCFLPIILFGQINKKHITRSFFLIEQPSSNVIITEGLMPSLDYDFIYDKITKLNTYIIEYAKKNHVNPNNIVIDRTSEDSEVLSLSYYHDIDANGLVFLNNLIDFLISEDMRSQKEKYLFSIFENFDCDSLEI